MRRAWEAVTGNPLLEDHRYRDSTGRLLGAIMRCQGRTSWSCYAVASDGTVSHLTDVNGPLLFAKQAVEDAVRGSLEKNS